MTVAHYEMEWVAADAVLGLARQRGWDETRDMASPLDYANPDEALEVVRHATFEKAVAHARKLIREGIVYFGKVVIVRCVADPDSFGQWLTTDLWSVDDETGEPNHLSAEG